MTAVEYIKEKLLGDEYWYEDMTFDQIIDKAKEIEEKRMLEFAGIVSVAAVSRGTGWSIIELYNEYK